MSWFPIKAPFVDHSGTRSWTVTAFVVQLLITITALALWFFAPEWIAERVAEAKTFLRDAFFAIVVGYVARRWTQSRNGDSSAKTEESKE